MHKNEYRRRRRELISLLNDDSLAIIFSGVEKKSSADQTYPFEVNRNFYYLTGIAQENSVLVIVKTALECHEYLFIDEKDPTIEKWTGYKLSIEDARELSGLDNVLLTSSFEGKINSLFDASGSHFGSIKTLYLDLDKEIKIQEATSTHEYQKSMLESHPELKDAVVDIFPLIARMRMKKSKEEIALIKEAIKTTEIGLLNVLKELSPGRYEYNLRNVFEFNVKEVSDAKIAFPSIVASGKNGVILHYPSASSSLKDGELVLLDVGASCEFYNGDISRTYPIGGKFSPLQKQIYEIVLGCNKATIKFMRPGLTLKEINDFATNYLAEECFAQGLIESKDAIRDVYYHSVSHHLGLDVHDVGDRSLPLEEGNVITCEPGLYFKKYGIGVRIEDDILITADGSLNLSSDIIKEVADIERFLISK